MKLGKRVILVAICLLGLAFAAMLRGGEQSGASLAANELSGCWRVVSAPAGPQTGELRDLGVGQDGDLWALGGPTNGSASYTYILHMDGAQWTSMPGPSFAQTVSQTYSLSVLKVFGQDDIWAAGGISYDTGNPAGSSMSGLVVHWDGQAWTTVLSDKVNGPINALDGVASNDLWAVGAVSGDDGGQPIILHWDGTTWTDYSPLGDAANAMHDVVALSTDNVWMVSYAGIWHWDGTTLLQDQSQYGTDIDAISADDIWVAHGSLGSNLVHWDGARWEQVAVPSPGSFTYLDSVTALAANDVWAVGSYDNQTLILRWDGASWQAMPNPVAGFSSSLERIVAVNGTLWALGSRGMSADDWARSKVLLRYSGAGCGSSGPQTPLNPPAPVPEEGSQEFVTGKSVSGVFLNYWLNNGGVLQQGYPISEPIGEQSELNGLIYTVQYFERAVFEWHPELKGTPYEVLLTQLGTFQYQQKYPDGAPNQRPNRDAGTVLFPETGKYLGGAFLSYWRDHGGVQQNGYPISDEFTEVSDLDGRPYTVQYFERAVFEWHPENEPPYNVLLSQLGTYRWQNKYVQKQQTGSVPRKIAGSVLSGYPVGLVGAGHYLVWPDIRGGGDLLHTIFAYDARQNSQQRISKSFPSSGNNLLITNGKVALWEGSGYDLERGMAYAVGISADVMALDADSLYYTGSNPTGHIAWYSYDLTSKVARELAEPSNFVDGAKAADGSLLWEEVVVKDVGVPQERSLHLAQAGVGGQPITIADGIGGFTGYGVSGENVVYSFFTEISNQTTYLYNMATGSRKVITLGRASDPVISGNRVAWVRWPDPAQSEANGWSIEVYDITSGKTSTAVGDLPVMPHDLVLLDGGMIAYTADVDMVTPGYDLFVVDVSR